MNESMKEQLKKLKPLILTKPEMACGDKKKNSGTKPPKKSG